MFGAIPLGAKLGRGCDCSKTRGERWINGFVEAFLLRS